MGGNDTEVPGSLADPNDIFYDQNFPPFLQTVEIDLKSWHSGYFSWFGRAVTLKMAILPKLLYLLCYIPSQSNPPELL